MASIPEICERVLELSTADDCVVFGSEDSQANIRWANNSTTTNGETASRELTIVSIRDGRVGAITRNYIDDASLADLVRESEAACDGKPRAEDAMPLVSGDGVPADWRAPADPTTVGVFQSFTPQLAKMFDRARGGKLASFGYAEHTASTVWLATSAGAYRRHTKRDGKVDFTVKTEDFARSAWAGQGTADFTDVDVTGLYRKAALGIDWQRRRIDLAPGRHEVLLEPSAVGDLAVYLYDSLTARDADEGRTVFAKPGGGNRTGEKLMHDSVRLYSDPNEPGMEFSPFVIASGSGSYGSVFDSGARIERTEWVRGGVIENLIRTRHWAKKTGSRATPYGSNIVFASEGPLLDEMIARTGRALLVTCFWYMRTVDPQTLLVTGLTRDGVYLVEDGEVKGAVNNFRWNMSPVHAFANIIEAGASIPSLPREFDEWGLVKMPALRIADFNMSSISAAT